MRTLQNDHTMTLYILTQRTSSESLSTFFPPADLSEHPDANVFIRNLPDEEASSKVRNDRRK